jgi:hypothetical protein
MNAIPNLTTTAPETDAVRENGPGARHRVHTVSEAVRAFTIRQDRIRPDKVVTIPNGIAQMTY